MPKFHKSILTHVLSLVFVSVIQFAISVSKANADCTQTTGSCLRNTYSCAVSKERLTVKYCCDLATGQADCKTLQASSSTAGTTANTKVANGALKLNPEDGCSGGINTALGCIPYDTKGFTAALLGFLVGIVGLIAIIVMLMATIMIMTGGSNPEQVKKGKELFTGGVTGLFFIIFSVTILRIIAGDIIKLPGF